MQNKKLFTMLLATVMLVCLCLCLATTGSAAEKTPVEFTVTTTLEDTLAEVAASEFNPDEYPVIIFEGDEEVTVENGVLFGLETLFYADGTRIPVGITGGTLRFAEGFAGDVSCANSYIFKEMNFYLADAAVNFYAGAGEVVFDTVVLSEDGTGALATLAADNATAAVFANWDDDAVAANKSGTKSLITTSLTLKNTHYESAPFNSGVTEDGQSFSAIHCYGAIRIIGWEGEEWTDAETAIVSAVDTRANFVLEDSRISGIRMRSNVAISPVAEMNFEMNDNSETGYDNTILNSLVGVGFGSINDAGRNNQGPWDLPEFDANITINGGAVSGRSVFFRGVIFKGDLNVVINGGKFGHEVIGAYSDDTKGRIEGYSKFTINGGEFTRAVYGPSGNCEGNSEAYGPVPTEENIKNLFTINGGAFKNDVVAGRVNGAIKVVINGGEITRNYFGTNPTKNGGGLYSLVITELNDGTISGNFYGTSYTSDKNEDNSPNTSNFRAGTVINRFNGGNIVGNCYGVGSISSVENVENNYEGTVISGTAYGTMYISYKYENESSEDNGKTMYYGTNVTGKVTNNYACKTKDAAGSAFLKKTLYYLGGSISGDLEVNMGKAGLTHSKGFQKVGVSPAGEACVIGGDVTINLNSIAGFVGQMDFFQKGTIKGNYTYHLDGLKGFNSNFYPFGGVCEGNVSVTLENATFNRKDSESETRSFVAVSSANVGGKIDIVMKNSSFTKKSTYNSISQVQDGDVSVTFENVTLKCDYKGITKNVGGTFTQVWKGTNSFANGFVNVSSGVTVGNIVNEVYDATLPGITCVQTPVGTTDEEGVFHPGTVKNIVTNCIFTKTVNGVRNVAAASVENIFTDCEFRTGFNGVYTSVSDIIYDSVKNTITRATMPENSSAYWFVGANADSATPVGVVYLETNVYDSEISYYKGSDNCLTYDANYTTSSDGKGTVINNFVRSSCRGSWWGSHHDSGGKITNILQGATINSSSMGANGKVISCETFVSDGTIAVGWIAANNASNLNSARSTLYIDDAIVYGEISPNDDSLANRSPKVVLRGVVKVYGEGTVVVTDVVEGAKIILMEDLVQGHNYVTFVDPTDMDKAIIVEKEGGVNGTYTTATGVLVADSAEKSIVGLVLEETVQVNLSLEERITLNLWLNETALKELMAEKNADATVTVSFGGEVLSEKTFALSGLAALELTADGFYKLPTATVHAGRFGEALVVTVTVGDKVIVLDTVGESALSVLALADAGYASFVEKITAAGEVVPEEYVRSRDLFAAIYNYGASTLGEELKAMENFVEDVAANPQAALGNNSVVAFRSMGLLMDNAIGLRFHGTVVGEIESITVTLNGVETNFFATSIDGTALTMETYVSLTAVAEELDIVVSVNGEMALRVVTSIKGYSEAVMDQEVRTLALAQLAQACYNMNA